MGWKVVLVGCGNMGYALLKGWVSAGALAPDDVAVVEPGEALRARAAELGVEALAGSGDIKAADLVVFAVKPQMVAQVVPDYRRLAEEGAAFLSVAAGTPVATFEELLGDDVAILRCMPNTPAAIGKGMMVVFSNPHVDDDMKRFVSELLATSGAVATIGDEAQMDAVTAVSGSGPAYVFHFIECLTQAAERAGLPADTAKLLAMQTVYGAADLAKESGEEPGRLREQVTSPGGTTAAALSVLMGEDRLLDLVSQAVEAAKKRSVELGK